MPSDFRGLHARVSGQNGILGIDYYWIRPSEFSYRRHNLLNLLGRVRARIFLVWSQDLQSAAFSEAVLAYPLAKSSQPSAAGSSPKTLTFDLAAGERPNSEQSAWA